jgi:imidazolonepropionase-like amidohydrolase
MAAAFARPGVLGGSLKALIKLPVASVIVALAILLITEAAPLAARAAPDDTLVLVGAKIYPSPAAEAIPNGIVVVRNGKIAVVGKSEDVTVPHGAKVLNCAGMVVMAGFQNSHVHFMEPKWRNAAVQPAPRLSAQLVTMFTIYGFTTVVDTGSVFENTNKLRTRIEAGEVTGPRIITAVATLFPPDGLPIYLREFRKEVPSWVPDEPATPEAAVSSVRRNVGASQDIVKLFTGSFLTYENIKPMPLDVARAAAAEAHDRDRLVFAHPSNIEGVQIALDAKVDVLAHTASASQAWGTDLVAAVVKNNMALIPTLKLWKFVTKDAPDPAIGEQLLQAGVGQLRDFSQAGGQVMFGTDVGFMGDYDPTDEYVYMARAGLTPMQILAALTTAPAARFKEDAHRGRVMVGMDADLVVLGSDPSEDVHNFTDVRQTIRQGKVIYPFSLPH